MTEDDLDPRTTMLAAITAVTHCDAKGYKDALARLPHVDVHGGSSADIDADVALFNGSGVAS